VGNPSRGHRGSRDGIKRGQRRRYKEEEKTSSSNDGAFPVEVDVTPEKVREVGKFNVPTQALCLCVFACSKPARTVSHTPAQPRAHSELQCENPPLGDFHKCYRACAAGVATILVTRKLGPLRSSPNKGNTVRRCHDFDIYNIYKQREQQIHVHAIREISY
jgi:hypothetical protein